MFHSTNGSIWTLVAPAPSNRTQLSTSPTANDVKHQRTHKDIFRFGNSSPVIHCKEAFCSKHVPLAAENTPHAFASLQTYIQTA
jgi:hypothetical protein